MNIYTSINDFITLDNAIVTTGTFDGVHVGHHHIIQTMKALAQQSNGETVLFTFFPHPRMVLHKDDNDLKLLSTLSEKLVLLDKAGIDHVIVQAFTPEFSRISSLDFVRNLLVEKIGTKKLVIGHDHRFGRNREGSFEHLKEYGPVYGFDVAEIPEQLINEVIISSTKIRKALHEGNVNLANNFLGYNYNLTGKVIEGKKIGNTIGFPTANIKVNENYKLIPAHGVYAVNIKYNKTNYKGVCNIGVKPTINEEQKESIEVYIFDFDQSIYGEELQIQFVHHLREEKKFESIDVLKNQIKIDVEQAKQLL